MTQPLSRWNCDGCGDEIVDPARALVISRRLENGATTDYRIVHKNMDGLSCDPGFGGGYSYSLELDTYLGPDGLAWILSELSLGPLRRGQGEKGVVDLDQFVDFIRRVQTPWYEEARQRFDDEDVRMGLADANEVLPYTQTVLKRIVDGPLD